jgi:hypothetical protein
MLLPGAITIMLPGFKAHLAAALAVAVATVSPTSSAFLLLQGFPQDGTA